MSNSITIVFDIQGLEGYSANHMYYHGVRRGGSSTFKSKVVGYSQYQMIFVEILRDFTSRLSEEGKKIIYDYLTHAEYSGSNLHVETDWTYGEMRTKSGKLKKKDASNLLKTVEDSIILAFEDEVVVETLQTYGSEYDDRHHNFTSTRKSVDNLMAQRAALTTLDDPFRSIEELVGESDRVLLITYMVDYYKVGKTWHYKLYRLSGNSRELVLDTNSQEEDNK